MVAEDDRRRYRRGEGVAALIVLFVYVVCLYNLPRHTFWSPDEGGKYLQTQAIGWESGLTYALPYAGARLDPKLDFYAHRRTGDNGTFIYPMRSSDDGSVHFHWSIWFSLAVKLPVALFGVTGGYLVALLAGWLTAVLAGFAAREIDARLAAPAVLAVGLATPIWFYSLCYWEHTLVTALGMLGTVLLMRRRAALASLPLILLSFAVAFLLRPDSALPAMAAVATIAVVAWLRPGSSVDARFEGPAQPGSRRTLLVLLVCLAVAIVGIGLTLPERHLVVLQELPQRWGGFERNWSTLAFLVADGSGAGGPAPRPGRRFLIMGGLLCCVLASFCGRARTQAALAVLGFGALFIVGSQLAGAGDYRSMHGLFTVAPFMVLAPLALRRPLPAVSSARTVLGLFSVFYGLCGVLAMSAVYGGQDGVPRLGLEWGQRYLLLLYPVLTVLSLAALDGFWRALNDSRLNAVAVVLGGALFVVGVTLQIRGFEQSYQTRSVLASLHAELEDGPPIVTEVWWVPAALAELYPRKEIYRVGRRSATSEWARHAVRYGHRQFTFVSFGPVADLELGPPPPRFVRLGERSIDRLWLTTYAMEDGAPMPP